VKRALYNRVKRLEERLDLDTKPLTLPKVFELLERERQGGKVNWDSYDLTLIKNILEGKK